MSIGPVIVKNGCRKSEYRQDDSYWYEADLEDYVPEDWRTRWDSTVGGCMNSIVPASSGVKFFVDSKKVTFRTSIGTQERDFKLVKEWIEKVNKTYP